MANLNLQDLLDMFQNGERRYAENPAFKAAIESLRGGLGVYAVLDHVLKDRSALSDAAIQLKTKYNLVYADNRNLTDEVETLKLEKRELAEHADRLKDEVASYKEALEAMTQSRDGYKDDWDNLSKHYD